MLTTCPDIELVALYLRSRFLPVDRDYWLRYFSGYTVWTRYPAAYYGMSPGMVSTQSQFSTANGLSSSPRTLVASLSSSTSKRSASPVLGQTTLALRAVSAVLGILTVVVAYLLARRMFDARVALLTCGWLTLSLWHVIFSRMGVAYDFATALPCRRVLLPLARA